MATVGEQMQISNHTIDKVTKAKVTLENYYSNLISQHEERENRYRILEQSMEEDGLSDEQKHEKRQQHAVKETEFLRLKRSRLGVEDFEPLKVIGKGAFGEVLDNVDVTISDGESNSSCSSDDVSTDPDSDGH